jgi:hypothetical protein
MTAWADHGPDGAGEPLAIVLRLGNAGSDTAAGHIEATRLPRARELPFLQCLDQEDDRSKQHTPPASPTT